MASSLTPDKVLVYLRRICHETAMKAAFKNCVLVYLGSNGGEMMVNCTLEDNMLVVSETTPNAESEAVLLKHPSSCPCRALTTGDIARIPEDSLERGVDCGVATLLWSSDHHLLLTRRADHLRTFPGVWVPPGGHVELGETLVEAGLRELEEETGIAVDVDHCSPRIVTLWESVYPSLLSRGLPRRHHILLYQSVRSSKDRNQLEQELKLDANEVGAASWLAEPLVRALADLSHHRGTEREAELRKRLPDTMSAVVVDSTTGVADHQNIPVPTQIGPPSSGEDVERISTGTLFAMERWCQLNPVT